MIKNNLFIDSKVKSMSFTGLIIILLIITTIVIGILLILSSMPQVSPASNTLPASNSNIPAPVHNIPAPIHNIPAPIHNIPAPIHNIPAPAIIPVIPTAPCTGKDYNYVNVGTNDINSVITPGTVINQCYGILSSDKVHAAVQQSDGNFVIYNKNTGSPVWATNTVGTIIQQYLPGKTVTPPYRTVYQADGNLVVYDSLNNVLWAANTVNKPSTALSMQGDGNLVMYNNGVPLWQSQTNGN